MQKREGFHGQQMIVLPKSVIEEVKNNDLINSLYVTDIGYYPHAEHHFRERKRGAKGNILIYCAAGMGWCKSFTEQYTIQPHTVCIIPAGVPHKYGAHPQKPWTIYWMHLEVKTFDLKQGSPEEHIQRVQVFDEIFQNLGIPYKKRNLEYANFLVFSFLTSIFYKDIKQSTAATKGKKIIDRSIEYMKQNLTSNIQLHDFSGQAGLSVSQYSNLFKKHASMSPMNFFIQLKVQRSCQLIENPYMRIKEIALELGFDDPLYFSRVFTKVMGISPLSFRKTVLGT
jgi:AraC-like DNA-binding protein